MALDQLGVNVSTLIAGAGSVGVAVGFGAQTLVKDCLSGFFLILDGVITAGDVIEMEQITGTVETLSAPGRLSPAGARRAASAVVLGYAADRAGGCSSSANCDERQRHRCT